MSFVSGIAIIVCILIFMVLCFKGNKPFIAALISACILAFFTKSGFIEAVFTNIPTSIGSSFVNTFFLFCAAGVMGEYYATSGFGQKMGNAVLKVIPRKYAPYIIFLVSILFNLASMPCHDWVVAAIAFPLMYAADMPLYLAFVANYGATIVIPFAMPGYASLPNILPAQIFGVDKIYYATSIGWVMTIVGLLLVLIYIVFLQKKAEKKGIHYAETDSGLGMYSMLKREGVATEAEVANVHALHAFVPIIITIGGALVLNMVVGMGSTPSLVIAQAVATLYIAIFSKGNFNDQKKHLTRIVDAMFNMMPVIMTVGMVSAFGALASDTEAFSSLLEKVLSLNINPYVLIVLIVCVLAALTSDAIAAMITIQSTEIATRLLATGANPANLAALLRITSAGFDTLPWSTNAIIPLQVFGFNYKTGYKYVFAMTVALPMIMTLIGLAMSMGMG